jgi:hypothetical protein
METTTEAEASTKKYIPADQSSPTVVTNYGRLGTGPATGFTNALDLKQ